MADEVRVWQVTSGDSLLDVPSAKLDLEERIESWITKDISVLVPDGSGLLVIGRQIRTDFDKEIDLLCMDGNGDLVIVELKRDMTPREVTAQALDYASWVETLDSSQIDEIAAGFLPNDKSLREAFEDAFDSDFPDVINGAHSMMIVASRIDDSSERIIRYLSSKGININFIRFHVFKCNDGVELLVRTFTIPIDEAEQNVMRGGKSKRTGPKKTLEIRLAECTNDAERAFLKERLADTAQTVDRTKRTLLYRFSEKIRFRLRARENHVHVVQNGRFPEDIAFWTTSLSLPKVHPRSRRRSLGFVLSTASDFQNFQKFMVGDACKLNWLPKTNADDGEEDDGEDGEG